MNIENLQKIKSLHQKVGDHIFRMSISHLFDVGVRNMTEDSFDKGIETITTTVTDNSFMSAKFQCYLLAISYELSLFSIWEILLYVKLYIGIEGDNILDRKAAEETVCMWAREEKAWQKALEHESLFDRIVNKLIDCHERNNFTEEEIVCAFDSVLMKNTGIKLRELLESYNDNPKDVDLYHWDSYSEAATMVDLSLNDFTDEGLEKFQDVLNMDVVEITEEDDDLVSVWVGGAHPSHVEEMASAHAGCCSIRNYNKWFTVGD